MGRWRRSMMGCLRTFRGEKTMARKRRSMARNRRSMALEGGEAWHS